MQLIVDGWRIDLAARTADRGEKTAQLSPRAVRLLQILSDAEGSVVSRNELLDQVWPNVVVSDESLTQVVSELRRTLQNRDLIATIARGGYRLTVPTLREAETVSVDDQKQAPFTIDAYALCIEARDCFDRGGEGSQRDFVALSAQAAALAPDYAEARALHALALLKRHVFWSEGATHLEDAAAEVDAAIQLDPALAHAYLTNAAIRVTLGSTEEGVRSLERALSLAPNDAGVHLEAAILLLSMRRKRSASALALKAAELSKGGFAAAMLAARILQYFDPVRGRVCAEMALRSVRSELETDPHSMRALYALGPLLAYVGDHRAARAALEGVTHHDSPLEYYRAIGFAQLGDSSAALERLDFLALRGWRHACILDADDGFQPLRSDRRLDRLKADILAA